MTTMPIRTPACSSRSWGAATRSALMHGGPGADHWTMPGPAGLTAGLAAIRGPVPGFWARFGRCGWGAQCGAGHIWVSRR